MSKPECPNKCKHGQVKNYKTMMLEDCNYCYPKYQGVNVMRDKLIVIKKGHYTIIVKYNGCRFICLNTYPINMDEIELNPLYFESLVKDRIFVSEKEGIFQDLLSPTHETVEQLEELKEENKDLNISIRKVTDERDMAIKAFEKLIKYVNGLGYVIDCNNDGVIIGEICEAEISLLKLKDNQDGE